MGELETLFAVLVALYLGECLCWVRRDTVVFTRWCGTRWRLRFPSECPGNQRGALLLAHPLPPLGALGVSQPLPLSLSPDAAFSWTGIALAPGARASQVARLVRWEDMRAINAEKKSVLVNGELFLATGSHSLARQIVALLRTMRDLPVEKRAAAIRETLRTSLDEAAVVGRIAAWERHIRPLRFLGNSLFLLLFALAPALVWKVGLRPALWFLVVALLAHTLSLSVLFRRAHQALFPADADDRFTPFLTMLLAPPTAIRAQDHLTRPLLEAFHPLAVARALSGPEDFARLARRVCVDLHHPLLPVCPVNDPAAVATVDWMHAAWLDAVNEALRRAQLEPGKLLAPPAPEEPANRAYCPRCGTQFLRPTGTCADCGGQPLVAFPSRSQPPT